MVSHNLAYFERNGYHFETLTFNFLSDFAYSSSIISWISKMGRKEVNGLLQIWVVLVLFLGRQAIPLPPHNIFYFYYQGREKSKAWDSGLESDSKEWEPLSSSNLNLAVAVCSEPCKENGAALCQDVQFIFPGNAWAEQAQQATTSALTGVEALEEEVDLLCLWDDLCFLEAFQHRNLSWVRSVWLQWATSNSDLERPLDGCLFSVLVMWLITHWTCPY